ncbi:hypothetical protein NDU88_008750 [Pleurodeles waltl]|uniref:Uncharacterized protein n=1 Tax=Pleurodeles waltl TaxID=8319 RepID=A0AAV7PT07_PLEWA|nr:hypothetical protein NDU88_008750 [Pleurodeles waltl]
MPRGKATGKATGKPARQLLFSEALRQQKHPPTEDPTTLPCANMTDDMQGATMDHILQEISAVGRKLEGMDNAMVALTAETRSMRLDIAGFQSQISGLDQRVAMVETQVASWTNRDLELSHLRSKLTDLEDRSRRNNVRLLGFPEGAEGADIFSYLRDILPKLTDITFDPPLEFQRAHRLGPKRQAGSGCPVQLLSACYDTCRPANYYRWRKHKGHSDRVVWRSGYQQTFTRRQQIGGEPSCPSAPSFDAWM